jgi:cell division protein FtsW (lipid II flippase)
MQFTTLPEYQARSRIVRDRLAAFLISAGSGVSVALAGAPWWAVLTAVVAILFLTYGVVCWLATHSKASRITTFLITWEREPEPSEPPDSS